MCKSSMHRPQDAARQWWRSLPSSELCPLSGFPVSLLPYPPFKLRKDPQNEHDYVAVDGKVLVMQLITSGSLKACDRQLQQTDITALDSHMQRCNLGRFRLGLVLELQNSITTSATRAERDAAEKNLRDLRAAAQKQLRRLLCIQKQRLQALRKEPKERTSYVNPAPAHPSTMQARPLKLVSLLPSTAKPPPVTIEVADDTVSMQQWRSSTVAAKDDDAVQRRLENAAWRIWGSKGLSSSVGRAEFSSSKDLLIFMNKPMQHIQAFSSSTSRGRPLHHASSVSRVAETSTQDQPIDLLKQPGTALLMATLSSFQEDPKDPKSGMHKWRLCTKEERTTVLDGQMRSRKENQFWRIWGMAQQQAAGPMRGMFTITEVSPPVFHACARTPSPEFRTWRASERPILPRLAPLTPPVFNDQGTVHSRMPVPTPVAVVSQPVPAVPSLSHGVSLPEGYVCVALPASMLQQMQPKLLVTPVLVPNA